MASFSTAESGLFSAGEYDEASRTLKVTFRNNGLTYLVAGVEPDLGNRFMTQPGKSDIWVRDLKPLGATRV